MSKQINNLRLLVPNSLRSKYEVKAPNGKVLEAFSSEENAINFMRETKDYIRK